jgi:hypothetical protein
MASRDSIRHAERLAFAGQPTSEQDGRFVME